MNFTATLAGVSVFRFFIVFSATIAILFAQVSADDGKYNQEKEKQQDDVGALDWRPWSPFPETSEKKAESQPPALVPLRGNMKRKGRRLWALSEPTCYEVSGQIDGENVTLKVFLPKGFLTDLASIPWYGRAIYNPANYAEAALIHDFLYAVGIPKKRRRADEYFRVALIQSGVGKGRAGRLYRAVRVGGSDGYANRHELKHLWSFKERELEQILPEFPLKGAVRFDWEFENSALRRGINDPYKFSGDPKDLSYYSPYLDKILAAYGYTSRINASLGLRSFYTLEHGLSEISKACPNAISVLDMPEFSGVIIR